MSVGRKVGETELYRLFDKSTKCSLSAGYGHGVVHKTAGYGFMLSVPKQMKPTEIFPQINNTVHIKVAVSRNHHTNKECVDIDAEPTWLKSNDTKNGMERWLHSTL